MAHRFRYRPLLVWAEQFNGFDGEAFKPALLPDGIADHCRREGDNLVIEDDCGVRMVAAPGDWIIGDESFVIIATNEKFAHYFEAVQ